MRFPGFEGEWENKEIGEILIIGSGKDYKHLSSGNIPVFGTGGQMTTVNKYLYDGESVFIGRKGTINRPEYFNGKFWTVDTLFYTHSFKKVLPKFVLYLFENINWLNYNEASGVPSLSKSTIEKININTPSITEQEKICTILSTIDKRIQTQSKIIEDSKSLKEAYIKKIFNRNLRFNDNYGNGFPEWRNKDFGEIIIFINKRNKANEKLPVYSINNIIGFVPQSDQFDGVDSNDRGYDIKIYKKIDKNTFAYNPARINVGSIGYSYNLENILISSLYVCFKTTDIVNDIFLLHYMKTDFFNKQVLENMEGGVRSYLFYENLSRIKIDLPCLKEQIMIADFLSKLDRKIKLETTFHKKLLIQKQFLLKNLFI